MRKFLFLFLFCLATATHTVFAFGTNLSAATSRQFVYAISNSPSGNSIVGYHIESNGALSTLPGSPYSTGGLGQGTSLLVSGDSGLVVSQNHRFLFAPNRGSNDIAVFRIESNGALTAVPGSPFPTGGITPTSLTIDDNLLFVSHTGLGLFTDCSGCDYRGFRVSQNGQLTPIDNATIKLSETPPSGPFAIRFSPDGRFLVGMETVSSKINVYRVLREASSEQAVLVPVPGSPFDSIGKLPLGFSFNPNNATQLFISNVETTNFGSVSSYLFSNSGQIAPIEKQVYSGEQATCWVNMTRDGQWLFATNTDSDTVSSYHVRPDGKLTVVETTSLPRTGVPASSTIHPVDMAMSVDDAFLYVLTRDVPSIIGFKIGANGKLTDNGTRKIDVPNAFPFGIVTVNLVKKSSGTSSED